MDIQAVITQNRSEAFQQKGQIETFPGQLKNSRLVIKEKGFTLKTDFNLKEKLQAYSLRHKIFCEELRWVNTSPDGFEIDSYDKTAVPFGIFDLNNDLLAYIRLLHHNTTFMLEKEFSLLIDNKSEFKKTPDIAETTRFCVSAEFRNTVISKDFAFHSLSLLLCKGVYHYCLHNRIRYIYTIVSYQLYKLLRIMGITSKLIGIPVTMPDGVKTAAVLIDWRIFEEVNLVQKPKMLEWFVRSEYVPDQAPPRQPETFSQHQAYA